MTTMDFKPETVDGAVFAAYSMSERKLQTQVVETAEKLGWLAYHTHDSRRSQAGFPDLTLIHPKRGELIFAELKTEKGRYGDAQWAWGVAIGAVELKAPNVRYFLWKPSHWISGEIEAMLRG